MLESVGGVSNEDSHLLPNTWILFHCLPFDMVFVSKWSIVPPMVPRLFEINDQPWYDT